MHPVRKSILEILKRDGQATVSEMADGLEMAPVSVRHHLDLLIADGLVYSPRVRRTAGAGRPQQVYALTAEADGYFPNNYRQLAEDSLHALKGVLSDEQILDVMAEMARRTASQAPPLPAHLNLDQRMTSIARFLSEQGYMAGFEVEGDEVILHTCNCPYSELVSPHRELCHMDLALVSQLTGMETQRIAHIAAGDSRCSYRLCPREAGYTQDIPLVFAVAAGSLANA